jgi:hypothetical protein
MREKKEGSKLVAESRESTLLGTDKFAKKLRNTKLPIAKEASFAY